MSAAAHAGRHQWGLAGSQQAAPAVDRHTQWPAVLVGLSGAAMALALVLVLLGVPARLGYDVDGPARKNSYDGHDPLKTMQSIDGNLKYVVEQTGDEPTQLNGRFTSIDRSEDGIAPLASTVKQMTASIVSIERQLSAVSSTTGTMHGEMDAMASDSASAAATMDSLGSNISALSGKMGGLYDATARLVASLAEIEAKAQGIADRRTSVAATTTHQLNGVLPDHVPPPRTDIPQRGAR